MRLPWPYRPDRFALLDNFSIEMLVLGCFGVITTSHWFAIRICGFSQKSVYRWSAFWPLIMFLPWLELLWSSPWGHADLFALGVSASFGLAFSITNLRAPSWYSRGLGIVFLLGHSFWLYTLFRRCQEYVNWQML